MSTTEWAKVSRPTKPKQLGPNQIVFEYDPDEYDGGYGPACGTVIHPFGADLRVEWFDGETTGIKRTDVRVARQPGTDFTFDGEVYNVDRYTNSGVILRLKQKQKTQQNTRTRSKRAAAKQNKPANKKQKKPAAAKPKKAAAAKQTKKAAAANKNKPAAAANKRKPSARNKRKRTGAAAKNADQQTGAAKSRRRVANSMTVRKRKQTAARTNAGKNAASSKVPVVEVTYKYVDPHDGRTATETTVTVPGFAFDTVFKKTVYVLGVSEDPAYFYLDDDDHPRRSRCHLRACTNAESAEAALAQLEKEQDEKTNVADKKEAAVEAAVEQEAAAAVVDQHQAPTSWKPCKNHPPLQPDCQQLMMDALKSVVTEDTPETYYPFVERVAKVYIGSRRVHPDDDLHADRDHALYCAIRVSFSVVLHVRTGVM